MLRQFLGALLCSVIFVAKLHAQEVIVAREKKPEAPKPTVQPVERVPSETPTPAPRKSKSPEKKSAPAILTLEEMRAAGVRAAEELNDRSVPRSTEVREPDLESHPARKPAEIETPKAVKRETPGEQRSSTRPSKSRTTNVEGVGPIRPTMIESGREAPSPSPSGR